MSLFRQDFLQSGQLLRRCGGGEQHIRQGGEALGGVAVDAAVGGEGDGGADGAVGADIAARCQGRGAHTGKAAFAAVPGGKWMEEAFRVQDGAVLVRLASVQAPSEEEWKMAEGEVNAQMMNDRMAMLYQTYIEQLAAKAKIKTYNSPLLSKLAQ